MAAATCVTVVVLLLGLQDTAHGARFLFLPYSFGSHVHQQMTVGKELVKRGHEVHMVLSDTFPDTAKFEGGNVQIHLHHSPGERAVLQNDWLSDW